MQLTFVCELCEFPQSSALQEIHHKIPRTVGGEEIPENETGICANCHKFVHSLSRLLKKSSVMVDDELQRYFPSSPIKRQKALQMARTIYHSREERKREYVEVRLKMAPDLNRILKDKAKISGIRGGRDAYIIYILNKHCQIPGN